MIDHKVPDFYKRDIELRLNDYESDEALKVVTNDPLDQMNWHKYAYNFTQFGLPLETDDLDTLLAEAWPQLNRETQRRLVMSDTRSSVFQTTRG